jgi:predicted house-cleaning noncanonical NTP pyrophosphatase (MazG superfamily)
MTVYNKAIRDNIPQIIKKSGKNYNIKELDDSEFLIELEKKLAEELTEFQESKSPEELADILEVVYRISELRGISLKDLDEIRKQKVEKHGGFQKNLFLIDTNQK